MSPSEENLNGTPNQSFSNLIKKISAGSHRKTLHKPFEEVLEEVFEEHVQARDWLHEESASPFAGKASPSKAYNQFQALSPKLGSPRVTATATSNVQHVQASAQSGLNMQAGLAELCCRLDFNLVKESAPSQQWGRRTAASRTAEGSAALNKTAPSQQWGRRTFVTRTARVVPSLGAQKQTATVPSVVSSPKGMSTTRAARGSRRIPHSAIITKRYSRGMARAGAPLALL